MATAAQTIIPNLGPLLEFIRSSQGGQNNLGQAGINLATDVGSKYAMGQLAPTLGAWGMGIAPLLGALQYNKGDGDGNFLNNFSLGAPGRDERGREALIQSMGGLGSAMTMNPIPLLATALGTKLATFEPGKGWGIGSNVGKDVQGIGGLFNKLTGRIDPNDYTGFYGRKGEDGKKSKDKEPKGSKGKFDISSLFASPQNQGNQGPGGSIGPYTDPAFMAYLNNISDAMGNQLYAQNPFSTRTGGGISMAGGPMMGMANTGMGGGIEGQYQLF